LTFSTKRLDHFRYNNGNLTDTALGKQSTDKKKQPQRNQKLSNKRKRYFKRSEAEILPRGISGLVWQEGKMTDHDLFKAGNCSL